MIQNPKDMIIKKTDSGWSIIPEIKNLNHKTITLDETVKQAFDVAYNNIYKFHHAQKLSKKIVENMKGVKCKRVARSIGSVGLYVPGGTAVFPSTALMLSVAKKNELRDEKQRLKGEKEQLEQQVKAMNSQQASFSVPFAAQGHQNGNKLVPFISYPGVAMWQFMPPTVVDTSQDHVLRPPVA